MDVQASAEYRYRAVMEVLGGAPIGEVAARYGTSRQSVDTWRRRFQDEGRPGLADRSRRPHRSPTRLASEVEAAICELRRQFPRWGARRISFELRQQGEATAPSRATVHRVLVRNGMVDAQEQQHKRVYWRWQRDAPMHLWQLDLVGGVPLADGREAKMLTGIDDHSRFVVVSAVLLIPTGRAVCEAFTAPMRRYGAPFEVLTDNGKQFTGRHTKPLPTEVMFEKLLRDNGITQRLTKPRSPTTTGKIERFHKTLRQELLYHVAPFESLAAAQQAIDDGLQRGRPSGYLLVFSVRFSSGQRPHTRSHVKVAGSESWLALRAGGHSRASPFGHATVSDLRPAFGATRSDVQLLVDPYKELQHHWDCRNCSVGEFARLAFRGQQRESLETTLEVLVGVLGVSPPDAARRRSEHRFRPRVLISIVVDAIEAFLQVCGHRAHLLSTGRRRKVRQASAERKHDRLVQRRCMPREDLNTCHTLKDLGQLDKPAKELVPCGDLRSPKSVLVEHRLKYEGDRHSGRWKPNQP